MATHGPVKQKAPASSCPSGIEDITAGYQVPAAPPFQQEPTGPPKPALVGPPGDNGRRRTGRNRCHFISSNTVSYCAVSAQPLLAGPPSAPSPQSWKATSAALETAAAEDAVDPALPVPASRPAA